MIPRGEGDGWVVDVDPGWPGFAGHFPGNPILPAAELIGFARIAMGDDVAGIEAARFLAPVRPGDRLMLERTNRTIAILRARRVVATISFAKRPAASAGSPADDPRPSS